MNRSIGLVACMLGLASVATAAEVGFTESLPAADFAAAGLNKLNAAERARLDALVRLYHSGSATEPRATAPVPGPTASAEAAVRRATVETRAPSAPPAAGQAKVIVAPGTQVEYSHVESRIAGEFSGWDRRTIFTLENGQRWQADGSSTYVGDRQQNPTVKIVPGMLGTYWMTIEGVRQRVKVKPLGGN